MVIILLALVGAFVAFIPGGSFVLIPLEALLLYQIAQKHNAFDFVSFVAITAALVTISGGLKGLATVLHAIPVIGQIANSLLAAGFILVFGLLADQYYAARAK